MKKNGTKGRSAHISPALRSLVKKTIAESDWLHHPPPGRVNIGWPVFDEKEVLQALDALLNVRISQGAKVRQFEEMAAKYVGTRFAIACNSGSSANLLALTALVESGKVPRGSEVLIPAMTFATVASPIIQAGLVPVYVDIDDHSWNIDPKEIEKAIGPKTRILMPVHTFGNPADMPALMKIARKHKLLVLEDCCEAHGAAIGTKKVGSFGYLATLSFFVAHNITTGEGGMIFTNDRDMYDVLRSLREFGRLPDEVMRGKRFTYPDEVLKDFDARYIFTRIGYNLRMTDITASLGIEQLKKLDALNKMRMSNVRAYLKALAPYSTYLILPTVAKGHFHSFYGFPFVIRKDAPFTRMHLVRFLEERGVETRPFFAGCLPDQPGFRNQAMRVAGKLPVARWTRDYSIFIGCHAALTPDHVQHVTKTFKDFFATMRNARVLVTGASGFLGTHVVRLLAEHGYRVSTLGRSDSAHPGLPHYKMDLSREVPTNAVQDVDTIVHLASDVSITRSIDNPSAHITNNSAMTFNLLEACRTVKTKPLIVYLSTDRLYGKARGSVNEQSPTFPIEPYTASKIMSEGALATYANLYGMPYIALRASAFFGPHQPRRSFIADIIQKMKEKNDITVGPLQTVKNFTYVENVASAVLLALEAPRSAYNRRYNIGGKPIALSEILAHVKGIVEKKLNKRIKIHIDRSLQLPQQNEVGPFEVVTDSAQKVLHWKQTVPLEEGLERTVDYFLTPRNHHLG